MTAITGIIQATQSTLQSTASGAYVDIGCTTTALANGVRYWVLYHCGAGAGSTSNEAFAQLLHGSTQVAEAGGEGSGSAHEFSSPGAFGTALHVVGDGTSVLKWQGKSGNATGVKFGAMWIIAIPMTLMGTQNVDWWYSDPGGATNTIDNAATGSNTTVLTETWTMPAEDVLVFASVELPQSGAAGTEDVGCRLLIGGTAVARTQLQENEDPTDVFCPSWALLKSGLSGSTTFAIDMQSFGAAVFDARRPRIFVIRKAVFNQVVRDTNTANNQSTSTTYADVSGYGATIVSTVVTAFILAVANHATSNNSTGGACLSRLHNQTDNTDFCTATGQPPNNSGQDVMLVSLAACEQRSASTEYRVQMAAAVSAQTAELGGLTGTVESELLLIELSVPDVVVSTIDPILMGADF